MVDTATKDAPAAKATAPAAAEAKAERAPRTTPEGGEVVSEIPSSNRQGFWATENDWFVQNPNVVKKYSNISPTTASYLRSEYGLEAHSRNTDKSTGRCDLYVKYDPATSQGLKDRPKQVRKNSKAAAAK